MRIVVAVDPADSGVGDQTGIVAGSLAPDGTVALIADVSAHLTSDAWANRAVELAITLGASSVVIEGFSAATTYSRLVAEAVRAQRPPHHIAVSTWPPKGRSRVGDAVSRSQGMLAGLENGRCRIAGHLPTLESDMAAWQGHQHQPDRVAAAVIAFDTLADGANRQGVTIAAPIEGHGRNRQVLGLGSGRPGIDALVAAQAARKRAAASGTDADAEPEVQRMAHVSSMAAYLSRRL